MSFAKVLFSLGAVSAWLSISTGAQTPPAEQLLPDDTIAVVTVPDWPKLNRFQESSPWGKLWSDPAMKPFRENFVSNFQADIIQPLERELGTKWADWKEVLQGQITLAVTPPTEGTEDVLGLLLMVDAKDKAETLQTRLAALRKSWTDAGKELKSEKIRDVEFQVVTISGADVDALLKKAFPAAEEEEEEEELGEPKKLTFRIGQHQSLFIAAENPKTIEKILARQSGGLVTPLAEHPGFQKSRQILSGESLTYGWLNFQPVYQQILKAAEAEAAGAEPAEPGMPNMRMDKVLPALGLAGLESISGRVGGSAEGTTIDLFASVPEAKREGLFKMGSLLKKDSAPPSFVPADAIKFQRWRLDSQQAWTTLEAMLGQIEPSLAGLLQLMMSTAGKEQDPNFDLKRNLIGNLGDDYITYQKKPDTKSATSLASPPALFLIGSPNPEQLVDAFRTVMSLMPPPLSSAPLKEREFLGKKIYSLSTAIPTVPSETVQEDQAGRTLSIVASGGYLAFSTDNAILEEYLRSADLAGKSLRDTSGLKEAAQKIAGMETGLFTFDNQAESMRLTLEVLKNDPEGLKQVVSMVFAGGDPEGRFGRWIKLDLLPQWDAISKYFHYTISAGSTTADGFILKAYGPNPPGLR